MPMFTFNVISMVKTMVKNSSKYLSIYKTQSNS